MNLYDSGSHVISSALPACPARFCGLFQKKRKTLQILECKMQLYGSLLWKSENVCHNCGTKQAHPLHRSVHALKHKAIPGCIILDVVSRTFGNRTQLLDWVRLDSVIELNRTHKNVPVRLCSIAEPIERLGSIGFNHGFLVRFADWVRRDNKRQGNLLL